MSSVKLPGKDWRPDMTDPVRHPAKTRARAAICALAGLVFLLAGCLGLQGRSDWNPLIGAAERSAEDIAASSIAVYISLRAINAALSTAQEIEVGASVIGQASVQPLKVLEPVDDTVERVAGAVFLVAAGAALFNVALAPVVSIGLAVLGAGLLGRCLIGLQPGLAAPMAPLCSRGISFGLAAGLALPLVFSLGVQAADGATAAQMSRAIAELDSVAHKARILIGAGDELPEAAPQPAEETGALAWLNGRASAVGSSISGVFEQSGRYLEAAQVFAGEADSILRASLALIGIFTLRMVVLPVLLLWGAMSLIRSLRPA